MTITESAIRERAYSIWEAEGRPHGQDQRHWYYAKTILILEDREGHERIARLATAAKPNKPTRKPASSRKKAAP